MSSAEEALRDYLENDFDPVPCPVCGHYQTYMFPKLLEARSLWGLVATMVLLVVGILSAVTTAYWGVSYLQGPEDEKLWRVITCCSVFAVVVLIGAGLSTAQRARVDRFDPNTEDEQARIEKGRSRALTRAEFDAKQRPTQ